MAGTVHGGVAAVLSLGMASCAALWGFDDATLATDGGFADAGADTSTTSSREAGPDVTAQDATLTDVAAEDATPVPHEATVDAGVDAPAAPACSPACGPGGTCERAVGGASICVSALSCTDSDACGFGAGCCVWLAFDSGTGRCTQSTGSPPAAVSCLCTPHGGQPKATCKKCAAPAGDPSAPVMVCGP